MPASRVSLMMVRSRSVPKPWTQYRLRDCVQGSISVLYLRAQSKAMPKWRTDQLFWLNVQKIMGENIMPETRDTILEIIARAVGAYNSATQGQISAEEQLAIARRVLSDLYWRGFKISQIDKVDD